MAKKGKETHSPNQPLHKAHQLLQGAKGYTRGSNLVVRTMGAARGRAPHRSSGVKWGISVNADFRFERNSRGFEKIEKSRAGT